MEVPLQNYNAFKSMPAFFIHQLSFISAILSSALTCDAVTHIISRTLPVQSLQRMQKIQKLLIIRHQFITKSKKKLIDISLKALNQALLRMNELV